MTHIASTAILLCTLLLMTACGGTASPETTPTRDAETTPRMTTASVEPSSQEPTPNGDTQPIAPASTQISSAAEQEKSSPTNVPQATDRPGIAASPSPTPTEAATEAPTPASSGGEAGIVPISEEQAKQELRKAGVLTIGWKTNFTLKSIDYSDIFSGGPGKDGIPAIDTPKFDTVAEADEWLDDREPVQVVNLNGDARAYPMQIMMWHEVVNDTVGGDPVVITY